MKKFVLIIGLSAFLIIPQLGHSSDSTEFDAAGAAYTRGQFDIALKEFKRLAESGDSISAYNIALMYANGQGVPKDDMVSALWMRKSADGGYATAQRHVALSIYNGEPGYNKSALEAFKYFKLASDQGDLAAIYNLAIMIEHGEACQQNNEEAYRLFKIAAERGYAKAQNSVGTILLKGRLGQPMNSPEGLKWLQKAADQKNAEAAYYLAIAYDNGEGCKPNPAEAFKWYKYAADLEYARAQNAVGVAYLKGIHGVKKNGNEAIKWFKLAAAQGDPDALNSLGVAYYDGKNVEQDRSKGIDYLIKAAAAGSIDAQNNIKGLTGN